MGEPDPGPGVELPAEFAEMLARLVRPGEGDAAAGAFDEALQLNDEELAVFLDQLAERIRASPLPLTSAELFSLVRGAAPGDASHRPPA